MINKEELRMDNFINYEASTHKIIELFQEGCTSECIQNKKEGVYKLYSHSYSELNPIQITKDWALRLGFKEIDCFTVAGNITFDLGRRKHLTIGCIATPNEMMVLNEISYKDPNEITDSIVIHDYDLCGYLSVHKLQNLISIHTI